MQRLAAQVLRNPVHFLAFGCGSGLAPKAPGTFGTLVENDADDVVLYGVIDKIMGMFY